MTATATKKATATRPNEAVLAYPDNQLKGQHRDFAETQSAFSIVKATFFDKK